MALFELDDVFGYQDANDMKKLWANTTTPENPAEGEVWLDISSTPYRLKRYNGTDWEIIAGLSNSELLESVKTVDGSGSELDADLLNGQEGSFYQDVSNLNAGTMSRAGLGDLRKDTEKELETSPYIQSGKHFTYAVGTPFTFDNAFTSTPKAVATSIYYNKTCGIAGVTTTALTVRLAEIDETSAGGSLYWVVIGRRL
jgi:hypothetical protein